MKIIDIKSVIIGVLGTILVFVSIGAKSQYEHLSDIVCNSITVLDRHPILELVKMVMVFFQPPTLMVNRHPILELVKMVMVFLQPSTLMVKRQPFLELLKMVVLVFLQPSTMVKRQPFLGLVKVALVYLRPSINTE